MLKQRDDKLTKKDELELGRKIQKMKKIRERMDNGYDKLTSKEEQIIIEGENALHVLTSNYYNFARKIAHDYHRTTKTRYSKEDLLQDAIFALVDAALNYDPSKGFHLSTYAYYKITKEVSKTINYQRLVRMPENRMGQYHQITKAQKAFRELPEKDKKKYENELEYVYLNLDIKKEDIDLILSNMQPQVSLNAHVYDGDGELMDLLVDEDSDNEIRVPGADGLHENLQPIINKLSDYEKDLIAYETGLLKASMDYSDFLIKHDLTDRKVKSETRKTIRKMRKIAEDVGN